MALPFQEAFDGSENPLADHWTAMPDDGTLFLGGSFKEVGGVARATDGFENVGCFVDDETFAADGYAQFTLLGMNADGAYNVGVILRRESASGDCYLAHVRAITSNARVYAQYYDFSEDTTTSIGPASYETIAAGIADNSLIRFEIEGADPCVITPYDDGTQCGDDVWDDSTLDNGGAAGIYAYASADVVDLMDDFEAGNLGGGGASGNPHYYYRQQ